MYGFSVDVREMMHHVNRVLFEEGGWMSADKLQSQVAIYLNVSESGMLWIYNDALNALVLEDKIHNRFHKQSNTLYYKAKTKNGKSIVSWR